MKKTCVHLGNLPVPAEPAGRSVVRIYNDAMERINGFNKLVERYRQKGQRGKRTILLYVTVVCYEDIISIEQRI